MQKEGQVRIPSGCAIVGAIDRAGGPICGEELIRAIAVMHDRSNGLGGGFAGYGIYPQYKELYAFHLFYEDSSAKETCERFLERHFDIVNLSKIPTRPHPRVTDAPLIWRYFMAPLPNKLEQSQLDEREYVRRCVTRVNTQMKGAHVFSSGKNMGVFKAVGYPEDVGEFYRPFALLDYSVVHNGEISSYDANRRFIEMFGYRCTLLTDTEVITYIIDYLVRQQGLTMEEASNVMAAPFWTTIAQQSPQRRERLTFLRQAFSSLLLTGPFSILVGFDGGLMALNDRLKLRSMVVGEADSRVYISSEESAIRAVQPELDRVWAPKGGEAAIFTVKEGALCR